MQFAVSDAGVGAPSVETRFSLNLSPGAPLNVVIGVVRDRSAVVQWDAPNAVPGIRFTGYSVLATDASGALISEQRVAAGVKSAVVAGLPAGSELHVAVAAHNDSRVSGARAACCVTVGEARRATRSNAMPFTMCWPQGLGRGFLTQQCSRAQQTRPRFELRLARSTPGLTQRARVGRSTSFPRIRSTKCCLNLNLYSSMSSVTMIRLLWSGEVR
jgi:hypothetical protein